MIRTGLIWSAVAVSIMAGILAWAAAQLPIGEPVPIRFDVDGAPVAYAGRTAALWSMAAMPLSTAIVAILLGLAPMIDPVREGLNRSRKALLAIWLGLLVVMTVTTAAVAFAIVTGGGGETAVYIPRVVLAASAGLIILVGNYLPKTRQSFFLGIRTPWTLTSASTWEKTHRLGGRLLLAVGVVSLVASILAPLEYAAHTLGIACIGAAIISVIYSYWIWRTADDRNEGPRFAD